MYRASNRKFTCIRYIIGMEKLRQEKPMRNLRWQPGICMTLSWFKLHWMMPFGKFYLVNSKWNADSTLTSIVSDTCHWADDIESRISPNLIPQQLRTNFMSTGLVALFLWVHSICSKVNQTWLVMLPVVAVFSFEVKRYKHCSVIPCAGKQEVFFFHGTH